MTDPDAFLRFAEAADGVREARGTNRKVRVVADYLASVPPDALPLAATFFTGRPFPRVDERTPRAGWATLRDAVLNVTPWDDVVYAACHRAVGDSGDTVEKLFALEAPRRRGRAQASLLDFAADAPASGGPMTLADAEAAFDALARTRSADERRRLVEEAWIRMSPIEAKYFTKILTGGMRIGLAESLVEEAIARAFERDVSDVRHANMVMGDVGRAARLAREDRLADAEFRLFHPLHFMLATPLDEIPETLEGFVAEDKFDGVRAELHASRGRAVVYSRTLDEAPEFPEILDAARAVAHGDVEFVLDGEVVAWRDGRVLPFAVLQRRLGRKKVPPDLLAEVPVRFVAYDVLYARGAPTYREPFTERRRVLESLPLAPPIVVAPAYAARTREDVERLFEAARERGNEGVMLKLADSAYEFGKRGKQWLKVKRAYATLDCVVTAAEVGHGKRAGLLSDYTFAVRGDGDELLNVGKAFTGLTNAEIEEMTRVFRGMTLERFGGVHVVEPRVVVEVAFDGVQQSARHKSGFALRFPRIVRLRPDKRPEDADTLGRVRELYEASLVGAT